MKKNYRWIGHKFENMEDIISITRDKYRFVATYTQHPSIFGRKLKIKRVIGNIEGSAAESINHWDSIKNKVWAFKDED